MVADVAVGVAAGVVGVTRCGEVVEVVECVDESARSIAVGGVLCSYQFYGRAVKTVAERVIEKGVEVLEMWEKLGMRCREVSEKIQSEGGFE